MAPSDGATAVLVAPRPRQLEERSSAPPRSFKELRPQRVTIHVCWNWSRRTACGINHHFPMIGSNPITSLAVSAAIRLRVPRKVNGQENRRRPLGRPDDSLRCFREVIFLGVEDILH